MSCILRPFAKFAQSLRKVFQRNKIEPDPTEDFDVSVAKYKPVTQCLLCVSLPAIYHSFIMYVFGI